MSKMTNPFETILTLAQEERWDIMISPADQFFLELRVGDLWGDDPVVYRRGSGYTVEQAATDLIENQLRASPE